MLTVKTISEVRENIRLARSAGKKIGFIPTMGGLHKGHFSLIASARKNCDYVAVSIFLNPTQFAPAEDLDKYPKTPQQDIEGCEEHGADLVFMPDVQTMYPAGAVTEVSLTGLSDKLCGQSRPTHFKGVCTVVAKLFNIVQPDVAYFGQKDYQQALIIRRMAEDLNFPVKIVICPIVREADGLAMSTRNKYLSPGQRKQAAALSGALNEAAELIRQNRPAAEVVLSGIKQYIAKNAPDGVVDYVKIVDPHTLEDADSTKSKVVIAIAVNFSSARLIDNMIVD